MSRLLCLVGIHRPVLPGEWNLGYCFSTCRGCGRDMVRSVLDGWHAPTAFRVVRGEALTAYDDLDKYLRSRERPRAQAHKIDMGPAPVPAPLSMTPAAESRRTAPAALDGSPFDFSDFDPKAGQTPQPPLKNVKTG